jgi:sugar lactone lactonase YvrE
MTKRAVELGSMVLVLAFGGFACGTETPREEEPALEESAEPSTIASGLNGPMGVVVDEAGDVWVIDSGTGGDAEIEFPNPFTLEITATPYGETARIIRIAGDGTQTEVATLPSMNLGEEAMGGARLAILDGELYATSGGWAAGASVDRLPYMAAVVRVDEGQVTEVANTWDLESSENPAGALVDTHPYDLTAGPDGMLWVADAAGNTLCRIDPATGDAELIAVFDALPSPIPNPSRDGAMETEPVPTGVAFDAEGNVYVSFLPGVPFLPGSAKVVRVASDGAVSDYATDLTMLTDLETGPDGSIYAVSIGEFTEQGPVPNSGAIIRIGEGTTSEAILTGLSFPTSIAFAPNGDAYITINGMGAPGSGEVMRYPGLVRGAD